ncbi:MAG: IS5 family transposase [Bacillota bacterium]
MYQPTEKQLSLNLFPKQLIIESNEWYHLERIMPWYEIENIMEGLFSNVGRNAIPVRQIIGALIIQTKLGLTDRDTLIFIQLTPMFQYFLGLPDYTPQELFDYTLLCKYRKIIGIDIAKEMIETLLTTNKVIIKKINFNITHQGTMSIDATVAPVNITYPTDLKLLNTVREQTESIIDACYEKSNLTVKPRTYRKEARTVYLKYAKAKRLSKEKRFSANRMQLQYIDRNLKTIETHVNQAVFVLTDDQIEYLKICKTIYNQQYGMWQNKVNRVDDRIVNFHQPHIRGIVRGKAGTNIEFGPKIEINKVDGYITIDKISFHNFNEGKTLIEAIQSYHQRHGVYPVNVNADKIYQTRENKQYCKELEIRLSGPKLGRKKTEDTTDKAIERIDFKKRLEIEGVFGVAKSKYGLSKLFTKLPESQRVSIGLIFFVMNLMQIHHKVSFYEKLEMYILMIIESDMTYAYEDEILNLQNVE